MSDASDSVVSGSQDESPVALNGPATLSDRVRSLRLPDRQSTE